MTQYFKVEEGTNTYKSLNELIEKIQAARSVNYDFAKSVGSENLITSSYYAAGGIVGFKMENPPTNWRQAAKGWQYAGFYYPRSIKENKELLKKINELPKIPRRELDQGVNMTGFNSPGIKTGDGFYILEIPSGGWTGNYKPFPDMIELTGSEWNKLSDEIEKSEKELA